MPCVQRVGRPSGFALSWGWDEEPVSDLQPEACDSIREVENLGFNEGPLWVGTTSRCGEMVNTADLKSAGTKVPCRFESGHRHPRYVGETVMNSPECSCPVKGTEKHEKASNPLK